MESSAGLTIAETPRAPSATSLAQMFRRDIESGALAHGSQLASTRDLAAQFGTSVATVTRAMSLLAGEGLIVNKARSGRIVHNPRASQPLAATRTGGPVVLLIGGYAGAGKTELGRMLARQTGWAICDKDTITRPVVEAALEGLGLSPRDRQSDVYLDVVRPAEYEALRETIMENVECGVSMIVTAPFIREFSDRAWCERIVADIESRSGSAHFVWVTVDVESQHRYLRGRGAARDTWKLDHWPQYRASLTVAYRPAVPHSLIDNSADAAPLQQQASELLERVAA